MNPHPLFCPNPHCPSGGQQNQGNLRLHDGIRQRWRCRTCGKTFSHRQGTAFSGLKTPEKVVIQVITLLAFGCPLQAIVQAFGFDERTVKAWQDKAGQHCQSVHTALVEQSNLSLQQVQADEVRVRLQKRVVVWMAMALCVPTRFWLGGVTSQHRDRSLLHDLAARVKACARLEPLLLVSDGLASYVSAWRKTFRTPLQTGKRGRPRLLTWPGLVIGQMVKQYQKGRVVDIDQRLVQGSIEELHVCLPEESKISTAYIERLNATVRSRLACLTRRGRALGRVPQTISRGMYLVGCLYNFCTPHHSLSQQQPTTPAMASGLAQGVWSLGDLLWYRVALPSVVTPKRRGRPPKSQAVVTQGGDRVVTTS